jgi:hypothetical protein
MHNNNIPNLFERYYIFSDDCKCLYVGFRTMLRNGTKSYVWAFTIVWENVVLFWHHIKGNSPTKVKVVV